MKKFYNYVARVSNSLDPYQAYQAQLLIRVQTVCKGYYQMMTAATGWERV